MGSIRPGTEVHLCHQRDGIAADRGGRDSKEQAIMQAVDAAGTASTRPKHVSSRECGTLVLE